MSESFVSLKARFFLYVWNLRCAFERFSEELRLVLEINQFVIFMKFGAFFFSKRFLDWLKLDKKKFF